MESTQSIDELIETKGREDKGLSFYLQALLFSLVHSQARTWSIREKRLLSWWYGAKCDDTRLLIRMMIDLAIPNTYFEVGQVNYTSQLILNNIYRTHKTATTIKVFSRTALTTKFSPRQRKRRITHLYPLFGSVRLGFAMLFSIRLHRKFGHISRMCSIIFLMLFRTRNKHRPAPDAPWLCWRDRTRLHRF